MDVIVCFGKQWRPFSLGCYTVRNILPVAQGQQVIGWTCALQTKQKVGGEHNVKIGFHI